MSEKLKKPILESTPVSNVDQFKKLYDGCRADMDELAARRAASMTPTTIISTEGRNKTADIYALLIAIVICSLTLVVLVCMLADRDNLEQRISKLERIVSDGQAE